MKFIMLMTTLCIGIAALAAGQALAPVERTEKYAIIDGEVVRYAPGQVIVIRGTDDREAVYALAPGALVPEEVKIGGRVSLYTEPSLDGKSPLVAWIAPAHPMRQGEGKVSGTVEAYAAGKSLTIVRADGSKTTYVIDKKSTVPNGLAVGKAVAVLPVTATDSSDAVAKTVTYVTTPAMDITR